MVTRSQRGGDQNTSPQPALRASVRCRVFTVHATKNPPKAHTSRPLDVWIYDRYSADLIFDDGDLVTWRTEKTVEQLRAIPTKGSMPERPGIGVGWGGPSESEPLSFSVLFGWSRPASRQAFPS